MKKIFKRLLWLLPAALIIFIVWYGWPRLPIITAFASKGMCSSVFLADKDPERVMKEDLSFFPISLARSTIDYESKSVTSSVLGLAKRKAVMRDGAGAVIVLESPEEKLLAGSFVIPDPGYSQDTMPWPKGDMMASSLPEGVDYEKLNVIIEEAFDAEGLKSFKKTLALAVVYDNVLIGERYLEGYDYLTRFHSWSMTKSITGAMTGILIEEGRMDLHAPVDVPEWSGDERSGITLDHILHTSSGLDWVENYFTISDATVMLMQSEDMFASVVSCEPAHEPGSYWNYSSGDANLLSGMIRKAIHEDSYYHRFPYTRLLHRIGMLNTIIETDASGLFVASSYCYGSARDWARFGMLFLNNGIFAGDTILSPEWVEYCRTEAPESDGYYGATFWLKEPNPINDLKDIPDDIYFADGFLGQRVYIIPSKKLVVVRMGYSLANISMNDLLRDIIETLPG